MIIITGTKRSGTSMWMQILKESGIQVLGSAFGKNWDKTIKDANKRGFYESPLRRGIYYATNPHPVTGTWLDPRATRHVGVKVFVPGTIRSDVAYLSRVIASVRPFRQYTKSLRRLYDMESEAIAKLREEEGKAPRPKGAHLDATLEWWLENFLLVRDVVTRQYPARLVAYESVLRNPDSVLGEIFDWLQTGDPKLAKNAIHPEDRTQSAEDASDIDHPHAPVFDEYYERVLSGAAFDQDFIRKLNETHEALLPELTRSLDELAQAQAARRQVLRERAKQGKVESPTGEESTHPARGRRDPLELDRLDALLHPALR